MKNKDTEKSLAELAYRGSVKLVKILRSFSPKQMAEKTKATGHTIEEMKFVLAHHERVVDALPRIKRLSIEDQPTRDLLARTFTIPIEDVFAQLQHAALLFDEVWIEIPLGFTSQGTKIWTRQGWLVKSDTDNPHRFTFHTAIGGDQIPGGAVLPQPMTISVDGIEADEDAIIKHAELMSSDDDLPGIDGGLFGLDMYYEGADLFARILLILGSDRLPNDLSLSKTKEEEAVEKNNRQRERMNLKPLLPTTPVKVDLTNTNLSDESLTPKLLKALLGWTAVKRSKPIARKDGTYYRRKPHDRRIPSPVDRRLAAREIFLSAPDAEFDLGGADRPPTLIFDVPNPKARL